jgi:uncharacterized protein
MNYSNPNNVSFPAAVSGASSLDFNKVLRGIYILMGAGLATTAIVAYLTATTPALLNLAAQPGMWLIAIIAQFAIVFALSFGVNRRWLSPTGAALGFFGYSALTGFTLSLVFLYFATNEPRALFSAFGTAAALFGCMTMFGLTTRMDLTKFGTYLMMALIGLVLAMVVNLFLNSGALGLIISWAGVLIFTGLTAYDTQKIKEMSYALEMQGDSSLTAKVSILGALTLYLDFINLFLFLLQIFGGGSND